MRYFLLLLIPILLSSFTSDSNNELFLKVHKKGYYYFANAKGKNVLKKKYTSASMFSEGLAVVTTDMKYGVINTAGEWVIPEKYYDIGDFHEGLAWFKYRATSLVGYIDTKGNRIIDPSYDYAEDFENGFAIVGVKNDEKTRLGKGAFKYFVINKQNEYLFDSAFTYINIFSDSSFQCYIKRDYYIIDFSGKILLKEKYIEKEDVDSLDSNFVEASQFYVSEPEFPNGDKGRVNFLINNMYYPETAKMKGIQGTVYVSFFIEKDGTVSHVKILRSPHPILSKEAMRVVREFPKWKPGEQDGKKVRVQFNMPLRFVLAG